MLDLDLLRCPGFGRGDERTGHLLQITVRLEKSGRQTIDERWRRFVGDEVQREFGSDMLCRCRMAREIGKSGPPLPEPALRVILADDSFCPWLVGASEENKFSAMIGIRG